MKINQLIKCWNSLARIKGCLDLAGWNLLVSYYPLSPLNILNKRRFTCFSNSGSWPTFTFKSLYS